MSAPLAERLSTVADLISRFGLASLEPALNVCTALSHDTSPLDVAVLGQFKSGKSSLLNAVLGDPVFPVGVIPVTAVITRASSGAQRLIRVTYDDGSVEEVAPDRLADFVTETGNPENRKRVAVVDVFMPSMAGWPGLRLVDTPGLGSVLAHNTETTRTWMPHVVVALVTVSAERPLSEEDRRLVEEARQIAPRVVVILTKVDLLTETQRAEVAGFLKGRLRATLGADVPVLPFSTRAETERWLIELRETVLLPVARGVAGERRAALSLKLNTLGRACQDYLTVGLRAAEHADAERDLLLRAVFDESVRVDVIRDELRLAGQRVHGAIRPTFEKAFLDHRGRIAQRTGSALAADLWTWQGNLARQAARYETWMADRLRAELASLAGEAAVIAVDLLAQAESRFRRIVEAFRDRLSGNIAHATGIAISPAAWEGERPQVSVVPVAVSRTFMIDWSMLSWVLPMGLIGRVFRRHLLGRVPWEVEKNLIRLAGDWASSTERAVDDLRSQAVLWVDTELATLDRMLRQRSVAASKFREALLRLERIAVQ